MKEEKQSTEARAEELESRVGSLEHMNLLARGRSLERASPPLSGRSTPKSHHSPNRDYLHKYHTVSTVYFIILNRLKIYFQYFYHFEGTSINVSSASPSICCLFS